MIEAYFIHLLILIGIYIILCASLNLTLGYTGLLNLGHIAFFGVGAYTSAILTKMGVAFGLAFLAAGIIASFCGIFVYFATKKLKGDYLALATLGFTFVVHSLMVNWISLTRGPLGIAGITKPTIFGILLTSNIAFLILVFVLCMLSLVVLWLIVSSPFGRLLQAARDDDLGLRVLGKNTYLLKYKVMAIAAFFAGIAGSLFAHYITYIEPGSFTLTQIVFVLTILIVGGLASLKGSAVACIILVLLPELLRFISMPSAVLGPLRQILYALILLFILLYKPRGICGRIDLQ